MAEKLVLGKYVLGCLVFLFCFFTDGQSAYLTGYWLELEKQAERRHACIYRVCSHLGGINIQNISFTSEMVFVGEKRNIYIYTYIKKEVRYPNFLFKNKLLNSGSSCAI